MKRFFKTHIFVVLVSLFAFSAVFAQQGALETLQQEGFSPRANINPMNSVGAQNRYEETSQMFLVNDAFLSRTLAESKGLGGLLGSLIQIIITLAAIWAVIEIAYYGAKYALVDSFTGKKLAIENIWPVAYGLIALLGVVILFNTINSDILKQLDGKSVLDKSKINPNKVPSAKALNKRVPCPHANNQVMTVADCNTIKARIDRFNARMDTASQQLQNMGINLSPEQLKTLHNKYYKKFNALRSSRNHYKRQVCGGNTACFSAFSAYVDNCIRSGNSCNNPKAKSVWEKIEQYESSQSQN